MLSVGNFSTESGRTLTTLTGLAVLLLNVLLRTGCRTLYVYNIMSGAAYYMHFGPALMDLES